MNYNTYGDCVKWCLYVSSPVTSRQKCTDILKHGP